MTRRAAAAAIAAILAACPAPRLPAAAYPTLTTNARGRLVVTQDAYLPDLTLTDLGLSGPEDLFVRGEEVFVADTGNQRVLVYDMRTGRADAIANAGFRAPTGVFVTSRGDLYVADPRAEKVFHFGADRRLAEVFSRPTTPAYGQGTAFKPRKVGVDRRGSVYIVGEGLGEGIVLLSNAGEFLGFFASNRTAMSFVERLQDLVLNEEVKQKLFPRLPPVFSSLHVMEDQGVVLSTSFRSRGHGLKKHNVAGANMLGPIVDIAPSPVDVTADAAGTMYLAHQEGLISVFAADGRYVFTIGMPAEIADLAGQFEKLTSVAVDAAGRIWAADGTKSFLQVFRPTAYALRTFDALRGYDRGDYDASLAAWRDVLASNEMSNLAHAGIGRVYQARQRYEAAAAEFRIAGSREEYGEAFWEVRNAWLQRNLPWVLAGLAALAVAAGAAGWFRRRSRRKARARAGGAGHRPPTAIRLLGGVLGRPADAFQELKRTRRGTPAVASIVIGAAWAVFLLDAAGRGYLFAESFGPRPNLAMMSLAFFAMLALFVAGNYLVSSINDGTGSVVEVYCMTGYALLPFVIVQPLAVALTHVLTPNEAFLVQLCRIVAFGWTFVALSIGVAETHEYLYRDALKSLLVSVFFMLIAVISMTIVVVLAGQAIDLVLSVIREVLARG